MYHALWLYSKAYKKLFTIWFIKCFCVSHCSVFGSDFGHYGRTWKASFGLFHLFIRGHDDHHHLGHLHGSYWRVLPHWRPNPRNEGFQCCRGSIGALFHDSPSWPFCPWLCRSSYHLQRLHQAAAL